MNSYKNLIKNGYCFLTNNISEKEIVSLKAGLEIEHQRLNDVKRINLTDLKNKVLIKKIFSYLDNKFITNVLDKISKIDNEVSIFPPFESMKNNFSSIRRADHGWHRDCGGQKDYKFCLEKLKNKNYRFGKIGIYLQTNSEYGGAIDIVPCSHFSGRKVKSSFSDLFTKSSLLLVDKFCLFLKNYIRQNNNKIDWGKFVIGNKRLLPIPGQIIIFDSGLLHRGTPIKVKIIKKLEELQGKVIEKNHHLNYNLRDNNKFVLYSHYANQIGIESYFFHRLRIDDNQNELEKWFTWLEKLDNRIPFKRKSLNILKKAEKNIRKFSL